jgi:anti-anti-sigma regulatory factor
MMMTSVRHFFAFFWETGATNSGSHLTGRKIQGRMRTIEPPLRNRIGWIANRVPAKTRHFILEAGASNLVDGTGAGALSEIAADMRQRGITFSIADLHLRPRMLLERSGLFDQIGHDHVFDQLEHAVRALAQQTEAGGVESKREA